MLVTIILFFGLTALEIANPWVAQDQESKFADVGLAMTKSTRVQMPSMVSTMSTCQQEELNVFKGNTCHCFHPT